MCNKLKPWFEGLAGLLFPRLCAGCDNSLTTLEISICRKCQINLPATGFETWEHNPVFQLFWGKVPVEFASAIYYYRKGELLQSVVHSLKYRGNREAGILLGRVAGQRLKQSVYYREPDFIIPVPLHPKKMKTRGFNQAEVISTGISLALGIPVISGLLQKQRHTASQTRKGRFARWQNVEGVFNISNPGRIENKHLLLVDDIITTGATLQACSTSLLNVSGTTVSVVTLGYASR